LQKGVSFHFGPVKSEDQFEDSLGKAGVSAGME